MSYARLDKDSDVYIYDDGSGELTCCWCLLDSRRSWMGTRVEMLLHLEKHAKAGHKVPAYAIERIEFEIQEGCTIFNQPLTDNGEM